jgi:hypothetical protein
VFPDSFNEVFVFVDFVKVSVFAPVLFSSTHRYFIIPPRT